MQGLTDCNAQECRFPGPNAQKSRGAPLVYPDLDVTATANVGEATIRIRSAECESKIVDFTFSSFESECLIGNLREGGGTKAGDYVAEVIHTENCSPPRLLINLLRL